MFIDCHAHLDFEQFNPDREEIIEACRQEGFSWIINVGTSLESSQKSIDLARRYPFIFASVGIHPHEAERVSKDAFEVLRRLLSADKVIALGEIGLDYYKNYSSPRAQKEVFRQQIRLAREFRKPLIIHCREAQEDLLSLLREEKAQETGGIIHSFAGDLTMLQESLNLGFFISFSGPVTYPNAANLREVVRSTPSDKILTETDCPFLSPQPRRGKRNEPLYVKYVAEKIAEIKQVNKEDILRAVSFNFQRLFALGDFKNRGKICYQIRNSLYLNLTDQCSNSCIFCHRLTNPVVYGHNLKLDRLPGAEEIWQGIGDPLKYKEIVFCGYSEPLIRLEIVKEIARRIKEKGGKVRINTNGQANLIHQRNILPELKDLVDEISVSLNAEDPEKYNRICRSRFKEDSYQAVCDFICEAKKYIPRVTATVVDIPEIDLEKCAEIARDKLGVNFKVRRFNVVG